MLLPPFCFNTSPHPRCANSPVGVGRCHLKWCHIFQADTGFHSFHTWWEDEVLSRDGGKCHITVSTCHCYRTAGGHHRRFGISYQYENRSFDTVRNQIYCKIFPVLLGFFKNVKMKIKNWNNILSYQTTFGWISGNYQLMFIFDKKKKERWIIWATTCESAGCSWRVNEMWFVRRAQTEHIVFQRSRHVGRDWTLKYRLLIYWVNTTLSLSTEVPTVSLCTTSWV